VVALDNDQGFTLGLGIAHNESHQSDEVTLLTPLLSTDGVAMIRIGDVKINAETFRDQQV
jgi:polynucleotide 5'-kinase involved in rRNA processing